MQAFNGGIALLNHRQKPNGSVLIFDAFYYILFLVLRHENCCSLICLCQSHTVF